MRILVIHPHLNVKGGSERLTKILLDGLKEMERDYKIITSLYDEEWFKEHVDKMTLLSPGSSFEKVKEHVEKVVREYEPSIAIVMVQDPAYCYMIKNADQRVKTLMYIHFPIDEEISEENLKEYEYYLRYPRLAPRYLDKADIVVVNSRRTRLAVEMLWPYTPYVVYPCIDKIFFKEEITEEELKRKENLVIYVGRFVSLKRQDLLLYQFRIVKERIRDARLALLGYVDPRHREYYEAVKRTYEELQDSLKDVELITSPDDKTLLEYYKISRVYVHLRIGEHFGMAPVEAMSQGTPIVMRLPTGLIEKIENITYGYFVETDHEIAKYIIHILSLDRDEYYKISKRCIEKAREFYYTNFAREVLELS
ncbi:MAG: glycosyltransferase family 4 protein [Crenarchaeota archaeon]|nr:glycosyltransferase family 4 protein [Thermoproteota archaeon]